jgi:hypothetical protein
MVTMKKTLLEIVQDILNDLDSDSVNSIDDTIEATQVANIVAQTYFDLISDRVIPEHFELFRLVALSDSERPNYMALADNVANLHTVWYNKSTDGDQEYVEIHWRDPLDFLRHTSARNSSAADTKIVLDFNSDTELLIFTDRMPFMYTSFDNKHVVFDSHDVAIDTTLQESKSRAYGELIPTVTLTNGFTFDFEAKYFPYLIAEAKSRSFSVLHKTLDSKVEQVARRHKGFIQREKYRFDQQKPNDRRGYGRTRSSNFRRGR